MTAPTGMSRSNGEPLSGWPYVYQALLDIWTTPKGSRVERRDYGAGLTGLIDAPANEASVLRCLMAAVQAHKWQPWFVIQSLQIAAGGQDGTFNIIVSGLYYPNAAQGDFSVVETMQGIQVQI